MRFRSPVRKDKLLVQSEQNLGASRKQNVNIMSYGFHLVIKGREQIEKQNFLIQL